MNELEKKQIIEKNKELLKERTELQLIKYDKRYELKEVEDQIIKYANEKHNYSELKKEKIKGFVSNMLQYAGIFSFIGIGLSLNILNINPVVLKGIYISLATIFGFCGGLLTLLYMDELKDHRKLIGEEYFDKENLNDLEITKLVKEEELKIINKKINVNSKKLDKIYDMCVNETIISPSNNEYSNDETVKIKQKKFEK